MGDSFTVSLQATKMIPPHLPGNAVLRSRLISRLDKIVDYKLAIVSAAAGYGKSTLLSEWSANLEMDSAVPIAVCWLSLDQADNDLTRFWAYVRGALDKIILGLHREAHPYTDEEELDTFINSLLDLTTGEPSLEQRDFVLVLDDYQIIENEDIHQSLKYFIDRIPPRVHLIIASRTKPPLSVLHYRVSNEIIELDTTDLCFDDEEAAEFLQNRLQLALSAGEIKILQKTFEGWPVGLQLSALSASKQAGATEYSLKSGLSNQSISDFFTTEVLAGLPTETMQFLLTTSVLDSLNASLCDYVTATTNSQDTLEALDLANLFVVPLGNDRTWYRYHRFFGEWLRARLEQTQPGLISVLHNRASQWYESDGMLDKAVRHDAVVDDWERVVSLMEDNYRALIVDLSGDMHQFPKSVLERSSIIYLMRAWTLLVVDRPDDAEMQLRLFEKAMQSNGLAIGETKEVQIHAEVAVIRATIAVQKRDFANGLRFANEALSQISQDDSFLQSWALSAVGSVSSRGNDPDEAILVLQESIVAARTADNAIAELISMYFLSQQYMRQGRLRRAMSVCGKMLTRIAQNDLGDLPYAGLARIGIGELQREKNELTQAEQSLRAGIESFHKGGSIVFLSDACIALAQTKLAQGDLDAGLRILENTVFFEQEQRIPKGVTGADAWLALFQLKTGNKRAALAWADAYDVRISNQADVPLAEVWEIIQAQILIASGQVSEALEILNRLISSAAANGRQGAMIQPLVMRALVLYAQKSESQAFAALSTVLELAQPESYVRVFADQGVAMGDFLQAYVDAKQSGSDYSNQGMLDYIEMLLSTIDSESIASGDRRVEHRGTAGQSLLTERELEVARLLVLGYSNNEVAETLFISHHTVHTHRYHIYSKLHVSNRRELVEALQAVGI